MAGVSQTPEVTMKRTKPTVDRRPDANVQLNGVTQADGSTVAWSTAFPR